MYYSEYYKFDSQNGEGVRCTLFISGCSRCCPDCFNNQTWDYKYGKEYTQEGIKAFLVYASYARYSANSSVIATATGFVHKANQYSEHVSEKTVSRLVEQARSGSQVYADRFMLYLDRNRALYPLWKPNCKTPQRYTAGTKIRQIG